ncbi:MAG: hypothetical protein C0600_10560, partial [Ignavibacteria bacterium]
MRTMRLLTKVAPLAITLFVFIFGTQTAEAQKLFRWAGGAATADWNLADNWQESADGGISWDPTTSFPGANDEVRFDGTGTTTSQVPSLAPNDYEVAKVVVSANHTITLLGNLDTDELDITSGTLLLNTPGYITVNTSVTFGTGAILNGVRQVTMYLNGTMSMADLTARVETNIYTILGIANFMLSDVVFMGTLDINGFQVPLGSDNLYMGPNPGGQIA